MNINRSQQAYRRLEDGAIDDIDAAVFTGDLFMLEENRIQFREMMDRWESKLIQLEQIQRETVDPRGWPNRESVKPQMGYSRIGLGNV